jgi:multidrug efflux pump subunit AcrA (membrane-fusion protein)
MREHVVDVSRDAGPVDTRGSAKDGTNTRPDDERDRDDDGKPTGAGYVAHIALDGNALVIDGRKKRLEPGMSVTAEVKAGRRPIISYLLSPLSALRTSSWRER